MSWQPKQSLSPPIAELRIPHHTPPPPPPPPQNSFPSREWNPIWPELRDCMARHHKEIEQLMSPCVLRNCSPCDCSPSAPGMDSLVMLPQGKPGKDLDLETISDHAGSDVPTASEEPIDEEENEDGSTRPSRTGGRQSLVPTDNRKSAQESAKEMKKQVHAQLEKLTHQETGEGNSIFVRLVTHNCFDMLTATIIMLNCLLIAWDVQHLTNHFGSLPEVQILSECCSIYFLLELFLRLAAFRMRYFTNEARYWNMFDLFLVFLSLIDTALNLFAGGNQSMGNVSSILKTLKMFRIIRVFRVIRFLRQLSDLATMIMHSFMDVLWALVLLMLIIYVFAVSITFQCSTFLKEQADQSQENWFSLLANDSRPGVAPTFDFFGSLPRSAASLIQAMLSGVSWRDMVNALVHVDEISVVLLFGYILFSHLAVLNVVTGVFIDNALENRKSQREYKIEQKLDQAADFERDVKSFFVALDTDGTGSVSLYELQMATQNPVLNAYFEALGFSTDDAERMFKLLDDDDSGEIALDEFLQGCIKMKGQASAVDLFKVMSMSRRLSQQLSEMEQRSADQMKHLEQTLSEYRQAPKQKSK